jgi:hypothetical protein
MAALSSGFGSGFDTEVRPRPSQDQYPQLRRINANMSCDRRRSISELGAGRPLSPRCAHHDRRPRRSKGTTCVRCGGPVSGRPATCPKTFRACRSGLIASGWLRRFAVALA